MSIKQVVARRVDGLGELRLLGRQVAFGVLGQLVGEDEQAVERRAQLVRHVGQELGLVLGGQGQLLGLLFQLLPGLFDFAVLAFDFLVLLGQQAGLFLQLLVGLLQFLLPGLQLLGQRLRLLEQVFCPHVGLDRVEHDADRFGQLIEESLMRRVEALERGQLQHALDLSFEDDRQHEDAARRRVAQAGRDADVVGRQVVEQDLLFLEGALADQALAQADLLAERLPSFRGVAGQQGQSRRCRSRIEDVEVGLLGRDHGAQFGQDHAADVG